MECYNEQGQQTNYQCDYTVSTEYGHYVWCGVPGNSGYKLKKSNQIDTNKCEKQMCQITFKLNKELNEKTFKIEIYNESWGLLGYNVEPISNSQWTWFAPIDTELANTELTVIFSYPKELTEQDKEKLKLRPLAYIPPVKIFSIKVPLPKFASVSSNDVCCRCLTKIDKNQSIHITKCSHKFHNSCLFDYLEKADLVDVKSCDCCQTNKIKSFDCPVCNVNKTNINLDNDVVFKYYSSIGKVEIPYAAFY